MSKQQVEVQSVIQSIAEEQVLFLKNRYKMEAAEIVSLYTGEHVTKASYGDAIRSIMLFNMQNAQRHGFIAS